VSVPWLFDEIVTLRRLYPTKSQTEIMEAIPDRTWCSICSRASELKIARIDKMHAYRRLRQSNAPQLLRQLRALREQQKVSRSELARKTGYLEGQILHWEHGDSRPTLQAIADIVDALGHEIVLRPKANEIVIPFPTRQRMMASR
jgi:DNA-binding transcriptional regulator YiaG